MSSTRAEREIALDITTLAAGGDGLGRDAEGRVTFVPYTAPGDRIRARLVAERAAWARGELVEVVVPSPSRVAPPCPLFAARACGGCQWQHVERAAQLAAKYAIVAGALRHAIARGLELQPILDAAPAYGWRRRARLHARGGALGFFAPRSHAIADQGGVGCVQLEPRLRDAVAAVRAAGPPDGEVDVALGEGGAVVVATRAPWPAGAALVGAAGIVGVETGDAAYGTIEIELEPGLWARAGDFAQASAAGNAALIGEAMAALGPGPGRLLELYAGGGNLTRAARAAGWDVTAADVVAPRRPIDGVRWLTGSAADALAQLQGERFDAILLDPPRTGAAEITHALAARRIVYVSCDPATLGRDLDALAAAGAIARRARPIDLMPQTSHVEVVVAIEST